MEPEDKTIINPPRTEEEKKEALKGQNSFAIGYDKCLDDAEIEQLIKVANQEAKPALVLDAADAASLETEYRRSSVCWLFREDYNWLYERVEPIIRKFNEKFNYDIYTYQGPMQLTVYDESDEGYYRWHLDTHPTALGRKFTVAIPLTDGADLEGGEFEVHTAGPPTKVLQKKGCPIVFPAWLIHRVTPVKKGTRYSLIIWIYGPAWR